jgi:hypothetical protein
VSSPLPRGPSSSATPPPRVRLNSHLPLFFLLSRSWAGRVFTSSFLLPFLILVDLRARVNLGDCVFSGRFSCLAKSPPPHHSLVATIANLLTGSLPI